MKIIPALLFSQIDQYIKIASNLISVCDILHIDITDQNYSDLISPNAIDIANSFKSNKNLKFKLNYHLMLDDTQKIFSELSKFADSNLFYIHLDKLNKEIFTKNVEKIVPTITIDQDPEIYKDILIQAKNIQIMMVKAGQQGNSFVPEALEKIIKIKNIGFKGLIHLDGHINPETISQIMKYKPDVLNVGSFICLDPDSPADAYWRLQNAILVHEMI